MNSGIIREADFIDSTSRALQYISYYHSRDFIAALYAAYQAEESPAARQAMAQILRNSKLCATGQRPICQDTGIVTVFVDVGMDVRWDSQQDLHTMVNSAVRRAYTDKDNPLRASMVEDPLGARRNTGDNTPAVLHTRLVSGAAVDVYLVAKGAGSENKARLAMLNPSDSVSEWVLKTLPTLGAGWCPPGVLGIGVGGTAEQAVLLAKRSLLEPIDMPQLQRRGATNERENLRLQLYEQINQMGIGAQGLGGQTTVLDVKILDGPTHAASLPVAMIPNCAATRHIHFCLTGDGGAEFPPPDLTSWPDISGALEGQRIDLNTLSRDDTKDWRIGQNLLLSGTLFTGRDAAHKRLQKMLEEGEKLPPELDFNNRFIYYVGPVDAVRDEAVGPAGPTTATRMDKFTTAQMLAYTGWLGMIGKAERSPATVDILRHSAAVYLIAVGGAAYLVSQAIRHAEVVAFAELGMEAIYRLEVKDMPVMVAVDRSGNSIHESGPRQWQTLRFPT